MSSNDQRRVDVYSVSQDDLHGDSTTPMEVTDRRSPIQKRRTIYDNEKRLFVEAYFNGKGITYTI